MTQVKKVTIPEVQAMKERGEIITMLTAYDYPMARIEDACGVDIILVGDSVGTVIQGEANTLPVTMEHMLYHTGLVKRAVQRAMVVFDMPFMSYQESAEQARRNAGRAIKEAGAEVVKLEGGERMAPVIEAICNIDIPVMAHIGLTPQSVHRMGGMKVQGREEAQRQQLLRDARAVEEAGAFSVVLECVPAELSAEITKSLRIPTIGIGCGPDCDGQVLVIHDLLGMDKNRKLKFVKQYASLEDVISGAVSQYIKEVQGKQFPTPEYAFGMTPKGKA